VFVAISAIEIQTIRTNFNKILVSWNHDLGMVRFSCVFEKNPATVWWGQKTSPGKPYTLQKILSNKKFRAYPTIGVWVKKKFIWPLPGFLCHFFVSQPLIEVARPLQGKPCIFEQTILNKSYRPTLTKA